MLPVKGVTEMKKKAFELALITAVIVTLLFSEAEPVSCWWFSAFPNPYSSSVSFSEGKPAIRFRLAEVIGELFELYF